MDSVATHPIFTKDYFESLLQKDRSDKTIQVSSVRTQLAVKKGENYASQLQRITVEFESADQGLQSVSLIAKFDLKHDNKLGDIMNEFDIFRKEIECYTKLLPSVEKLLRSIGDDSILAPKCLDADYAQRYLVFEDLSASGYATTNRHDGLGVDHYRLMLNKLAKWHAATAVLIREDSNITTLFRKEMGDVSDPAAMQIVSRNLALSLVDAAHEMPAHREIGDKIEMLLPTLFERITKAMKRNLDPPGFNVITHGDLWSNNMMFTSSNDRPVDVKFVDFQMGCHTSHVVDLQYALYSSSHRDITAADWSELIEYYYEVLAETLRSLAYPDELIPTLEGLWSEWKRQGAGAAVSLHLIACIRMCTFENGYEMGRIFGSSRADREYRRDAVLQVSSRKSIEFLLEYSDKSGFYDN